MQRPWRAHGSPAGPTGSLDMVEENRALINVGRIFRGQVDLVSWALGAVDFIQYPVV